MHAALLALALAQAHSADLNIGEFQPNTYGDWTATGTAFSLGPASGKLLPKLEILNAADDAVISSEIEDDKPTGTLTSPAFKISRGYIAFRIGGGRYERRTCLDLLINGKVVRSATGRNSDHLMPQSWDVRKFRGQTAQVRAVDDASGDWGHINVDHIVQTDAPEQLPVVTQPLYEETLRPQFHFTARQWTMDRLNPGPKEEGWINDLNGLIFYDGEYHLFAQRWYKCWLHAVSKDLIHWKELEPAFWEESLESGTQSGTCVVDYENTSGLAKDKAHPAMIAFWSRADNQTQCCCYSLDHGRTWKFYEKNPLMVFPERDPKVFWYAPGKHWVMMMYGSGQYHVFTSPNLLDWQNEHNPIPDSYECPDFFELPLDGNPDQKKWVLIQGNGNYSVGTFDGKKFTEETPRNACDIGPNFYATQTWSNVETGDGRRIQAAWMRGADFPDMPFNQEISFPCVLTLKSTPAGPRIYRNPISEIAKLHKAHQTWTNQILQPGKVLPLATTGDLFHIKAEVAIPKGATLHFSLRGVPVEFTSKTIHSGDSHGVTQGTVETIEVLLDRGSLETFVNQGEISCTRYALPNKPGLSINAEGAPITLKSLTVYELKSAWK